MRETKNTIVAHPFEDPMFGSLLIETTTSEVVGNDHIRNCVKDELDVLCVGSTCHVAIDLFSCRFIFSFKLSLDISSGFAIFLSA